MSASTKLRWTLLAGAGLLLYYRFLRQRVLNWGAADGEVTRPLPGDSLLPNARLQTTRAITIDAAPDDIWPWLVQMGPRPRAGAYTYDWIERLLGIDIESKDRILPEFQELKPGETLGIDKRGSGLVVRGVEPKRSIVLQWQPATSTWSFTLEPQPDGGTRLLSRNRLPIRGPFVWLAMVLFMEPGSLIMERKMLLGIKERAERLARGELERPPPSARPDPAT